MARKRMFDSEIIGQDSFIELPMEAKALYFLLGMEADDEGFVNYKKVLRLYGGMEDSIRILAMKGFIIPFKSGVVVITDWNINNYLDKNRVTKTIYQSEKKQLNFNQITKKYEMLFNPLNSSVKHSLNKCLTSIEEYRVEENSLEECRVDDVVDRQEEQAPMSSASDNLDRQEEQAPLPKKDTNILQYLKTNFERNISLSEIEKLYSYQSTFTNDIIIEAIDRACLNNVKTIGYVVGILNSWKTKGFKNLKECKQEVNQMKKSKIGYQASEPEWFNKKIEKRQVQENEIKEMEELLKEYK